MVSALCSGDASWPDGVSQQDSSKTKEEIMRNKITKLTLLAGLPILLAATAGFAEWPFRLEGTIPFEFRVMDQKLPAGDYTISGSPIGNNSVIRIGNRDGSVTVNIITHGAGSARKQAGSYLVFSRYGQHYFLSEVWNASVNVGRQLTRSRAEREFALAPPALVARGGQSPEYVVLRVR
jgi:hypothetical protein